MKDLLEQLIDFVTEKWHRAVEGKYGEDDLSGVLALVGLIFLGVNIFVMKLWLLIIAIALLAYAVFRCVSSQIEFHKKELNAYYKVKDAVVSGGQYIAKQVMRFIHFIGIKHMKQIKADRDASDAEHYVFTCPGCGQQVRIPKRDKKGRVSITCPVCKTTFIKYRY